MANGNKGEGWPIEVRVKDGHEQHHQHRGQPREDQHEGKVVTQRLASHPLQVVAGKEKKNL